MTLAFHPPLGAMTPSYFDAPTFFSPHYELEVWMGNGDLIPVKHNALVKILPKLPHHHKYQSHSIDMAPVVSQLAHSLRSRRISAGLITTLLGDVIEAIDMTNGGTEAFKIRISHILQTYLEHDVNSPQQFSEGLKQSRRRFITLAAFAKRTRSRVLASALASFFIQRGDDIIDRERSRLFTLWAIAIWDIRSLISPNDAVVCFQYLCARLDNIHDAFYTQRYRDKRLGHLIKALEPMAPRHEGCDICCNDMRIGMGMDECICHCHGGPFTPYMVPPTQYQGFPALGGAPMDEVDVLQQKLMHLDERVSHLEEHAHPYPHMLGYY